MNYSTSTSVCRKQVTRKRRVAIFFTAHVQRISNCDKVEKSFFVPDEVLNVLVYGLLRESTISGSLNNM